MGKKNAGRESGTSEYGISRRETGTVVTLKPLPVLICGVLRSVSVLHQENYHSVVPVLQRIILPTGIGEAISLPTNDL